MENVTVRNQSVAGILNEKQITSVRRLTSENSVPAVINRDGVAHLVLIDSTLSGGSGGNAAIRNEDGARMFLRNIKTSGYGAAVDDGGSRVPGPDIGEWVSDPAFSQFASPKRSLNLPIRETPKYANTNPNDWANVVAYGAKKCTQGAKTCTDDSTVGIQAAMNSSKPVVYFPNGFYRMSRTVTIPDSVRMVVGFEAKISPSEAGVGPAFVVKNKAGQTTTLERLVLNSNWWTRSGRVSFTNPQIRHEGAGELVVRDATMGGLATEDGSGPLFVDNYSSGPLEVGRNTKVWVRQLNTEREGLRVKNTGGTLWVLGHKTELVSAPSVEAYGGATEILGAWYYHPHHKIRPAGVPVIRIKDGQFSGIWSTGNLGDWTDHVVETQNGVNKTLTRDAISTERGTGRAMPLYTSKANDR
jgi:hypothetical protein